MIRREYRIHVAEIINEINSLLLINKKVAIIGGHYSLLYEKKSDSLKPVIHQDFEDWGNKTFSINNSKNFPIKSFELGLSLYINYISKKIECKCIIVVNDEAITKRQFRGEEHFNLIKTKGRKLRKQYYSTDENLPESFKLILERNGLKSDEVFEKFDAVYPTNDNTPNLESIFVSERKLCKKFKRTIQELKIYDRLFQTVISDEIETDIMDFRLNSGYSNSICLIEGGECNCGGKAFEFYFELLQKGFRTIIFFVPNDCIEQVNIGAKLIYNSDSFLNDKFNIINISNIESLPPEENTDKEILLNYFSKP